ncbi:hypothetical protein [Pseudomonas faucium]|uniref:hypothetical protein n=1 Tax=Pseudomonas faucium TaxID=2740518 RepID=UPI0015965B60|nr:hypothetical protein [Pseudomonas faucium]
MLWISINGEGFERHPRWKRSIGIDRTGLAFIAAAVGGSEKDVSLLTLKTGAPSLICFDHVYVPASWMIENFPQSLCNSYALLVQAKEHLQRIIEQKANRLGCCTY